MMFTRFRLAAILVLAVSGLLSACGREPEAPAPPPPEVAVQTVGEAGVPLDLTYTARTMGSREVEVRARVSGILLQRRYKEGSRVRQGQPMFLIDPEPVRARVATARAEVAVAKARLEEARRQHERILKLVEQNLVSESGRDEAVSTYEVAQANLAAAQAQQRMAELDLEYTDVRAPIGGLTSREVLSEGSLVSTDQASSLLTKIVQVDPLYIEFAVPEAEAALIRASLAPANKASPPNVKLLLENGETYPDGAQITFVDNIVDVGSGTVGVRAELRNPEGALIPGQFIRAKIEGVMLGAVVAIPRKAVMSSAQGSFVWLVGADDKVAMRPVQLGRSMGNDIIVIDGLAAGDRYIVEGVLKVQPGIAVSAVSVDPGARRAESEAAAQPARADKESA